MDKPLFQVIGIQRDGTRVTLAENVTKPTAEAAMCGAIVSLQFERVVIRRQRERAPERNGQPAENRTL